MLKCKNGRHGNEFGIKMILWKEARAMCLKATGAKEFLQGYLTCNTDYITQGSYLSFALCDIKGRVLANGWATQREDQVFLIVHRSTLSLVRKHLAPYLNFSQCSAEEADYSIYLQRSELGDEAGLFGYEIASLSIFDSQEEAVKEDISEAIKELLISKGVSFIEERVSGRHLPQVLRMQETGGLDFEKGCYLGQEVIARVQFKGRTKKALEKFSWEEDSEPPTVGQKYSSSGQNGEIVMTGKTLGLWITSASG